MTTTINASTSAGLVQTADNSGVLALQTANTTAVTIDSSQNVGIGTSSPSAKFNIDGASSDAVALFTNTGTLSAGGNGLRLGIDNSLNAYVNNTKAGPLILYTSNAERMRIDSSGNVGIGTSSPAGRLHVSSTGDVEVRSATTGANYATFRIKNSTNDYSMQIRTDQSNAWTLRDETAGANRLLIRASDGLLFSPPMYATTSGNSANVVVNPDGGVLRSTSALKYKQDIRDLPSIDITKFRPIVYKSKCEGDDQTKDHFGFIADEVDAAGIKELVQYGAKGEIEGFSYDRLSAVLVKAIQELKAINDQQAETINAQSEAIASLTARVVALEGK